MSEPPPERPVEDLERELDEIWRDVIRRGPGDPANKKRRMREEEIEDAQRRIEELEREIQRRRGP